MSRISWMVPAVLLTACGGGGGRSDALTGTAWALQPSTDGAFAALSFSSNGAYALGLFTRGAAELSFYQEEAGGYTISGDTLTTVATRATCPNAIGSRAVTFTVSADNLAISDPTGMVTFMRATHGPAPAADSTVTCFADQFALTPSGLAPP